MRRFLLALALACIAPAVLAQAPPDKATRVLFIGNALTGGGDLAARVAKVAAATGRNVVAETLTANGYDLDDHWRDGQAREALRRGWDVVVLQQDVPAAPRAARFVADVKRFATEIRQSGARPALFMSWPRADRPAAFRDAIALHREAAKAADAVLIPVAEAWLRALGEDRRLKLYAGEGTQPAPLGNDLAVLTTYFALFPAGPQEFDEAFVRKLAAALETPADRRDLLIDVATRAIDEPLALGGKRSP